ncbi:MAG: hypothetical protein CSA66_00610 [Proteobacteria bacterium]|nr:MAG: hypothetical protein CSA66_00610 [Pseudomonadota bacterium]
MNEATTDAEARRRGLGRELLRGLTWPTLAVALHRRARLVLLLTIGTGALISGIYANHGLSDLPIAVVDDDGTNLTRTLAMSLDATRELAVRDGYDDFAAASAAVERGELAAAVWLPSDLTASIKRGRAAGVALVVDGTNILVSKTAHRVAHNTLATVSAGVEITIARKGGYSAEQALGRAAPIGIDVVRPWNANGSYAVYLAPPLLLFNLHLFCLTLAIFLLAPPSPTPPRFAPSAHPAARAAGLLGALIPVSALVLLMGAVALPALGLSLHGDIGASFAFALAFAFVSLLEAAALRALIPSAPLALQATAALGALSLMLSGVTYTLDLFPPALRAVAESLPLTPAAHAVRDLVAGPEVAAIGAPRWQALGSQALLFASLIAVGLAVRGLWRLIRRHPEATSHPAKVSP